MLKIKLFALLTLISSLAFGQADIEKKIQTQMIMAKDGSTIDITEGSFSITKSLSIEGKKNITIRGKGMDKTILSFKNQVAGAEGIRVTDCENITIEDMTVQDSKGDLIKTLHVKGITFRRVKAEWTGTPKKTNGAYALYPVQCENVLIEGCTARGASDAGIYVGQSKQIVVKNCLATENVAGIEIENSLHAEVFDNVAQGNVGGILVFDLPDLVLKRGGYVKVYRNKIIENNLSNFAPKGNIVAKVPKGTGVLILATNNVEVFDNQIINNRSCGMGIISYYMTENPIKDKDYYPYPTAIYVHDNTFERRHERATGEGRFGQIFRFKLRFGKNVPHILYDGIVDPKTKDASGKIKPESRVCIKNNKNQTVANMDAKNDFKNISKDPSVFDCELK
ncbi:MAG: right-handed parallel beta-helix repeat-containing protein [Saprospiraceae bacterium]|nr:right-handed parallel beta-helix repeat-containing protein [Saprospiraceae bacterium]